MVNKLKLPGLLLIIIGIFMMIIQPFQPITGAVIDVSTGPTRANFLIGIFLILSGLGLLLWDRLD